MYAIQENGTDNLWLQPLDGSPGRQLTNFTDGTIARIHFSPDGKTLAMLHAHTESDAVLLRDTSAQ